jgi:tRNA(fMet)-specific endonuclease VapC
MTAFDSDILSDVLYQDPAYVRRFGQIPQADRCLPVVAVEEALRGRLDGIRRAQAGRIRLTLPRAYDLFRDTLEDTRLFRILPYTPAADALYRQWRAAKIRVGTNDLRIAAICVDHGAKLVTRNARDYALVPGLNLEVWN